MSSPIAAHREAIDGLPASPVMAAALESIDRRARENTARKVARQSRIDSDRRVAIRRAARAALDREYAEGMDGSFLLFADMAAGRLAKRAMLTSLVKARIALLDNDHKTARQFIRDAIFARRQHWTVTRLEPGFVRLEAVRVTREAMSAPVVAGAVRLSEVA